MSKKLDYPTAHRMVNIKRTHDDRIRLEGINASRLINDLLDAYFDENPNPEYYSPLERRVMRLEKMLSELELES